MPANPRHLLCLALAVPVAAVAVAGCGGSDDKSGNDVKASSPPSAKTKTKTPAPAAGALQLSADPTGKIAFDKKSLSAKAGQVSIAMENPSGSGVPHAIAIEGNGVDKDGQTAQPGGDSSVSVKLKPGKYTFYCPVADHRQEGMQGTLTVK